MRNLLYMALAVITALVLLFGCASLKAGNGVVYEGAAMGYRGMIHVRVGYEQGTITEITVIESQEDRAIGGAAIEELTDLVLMYNTTEIDAVSGATETSKGFLEAIENAIMNL
jgi:uncharacterized protein with FMN-binding domain